MVVNEDLISFFMGGIQVGIILSAVPWCVGQVFRVANKIILH